MLALWECPFSCMWIISGLLNENSLGSHVLMWHISIVVYFCEMWCSLFRCSYIEHLHSPLLCSLSSTCSACVIVRVLLEGVCLLTVYIGICLGCYHVFRAELEVSGRMAMIVKQPVLRMMSVVSVKPIIMSVFLLEQGNVLSLFIYNQTDRCQNWICPGRGW